MFPNIFMASTSINKQMYAQQSGSCGVHDWKNKYYIYSCYCGRSPKCSVARRPPADVDLVTLLVIVFNSFQQCPPICKTHPTSKRKHRQAQERAQTWCSYKERNRHTHKFTAGRCFPRNIFTTLSRRIQHLTNMQQQLIQLINGWRSNLMNTRRSSPISSMLLQCNPPMATITGPRQIWLTGTNTALAKPAPMATPRTHYQISHSCCVCSYFQVYFWVPPL